MGRPCAAPPDTPVARSILVRRPERRTARTVDPSTNATHVPAAAPPAEADGATRIGLVPSAFTGQTPGSVNAGARVVVVVAPAPVVTPVLRFGSGIVATPGTGTAVGAGTGPKPGGTP